VERYLNVSGARVAIVRSAAERDARKHEAEVKAANRRYLEEATARMMADKKREAMNRVRLLTGVRDKAGNGAKEQAERRTQTLQLLLSELDESSSGSPRSLAASTRPTPRGLMLGESVVVLNGQHVHPAPSAASGEPARVVIEVDRDCNADVRIQPTSSAAAPTKPPTKDPANAAPDPAYQQQRMPSPRAGSPRAQPQWSPRFTKPIDQHRFGAGGTKHKLRANLPPLVNDQGAVGAASFAHTAYAAPWPPSRASTPRSASRSPRSPRSSSPRDCPARPLPPPPW